VDSRANGNLPLRVPNIADIIMRMPAVAEVKISPVLIGL
jgi:hypothetical protein